MARAHTVYVVGNEKLYVQACFTVKWECQAWLKLNHNGEEWFVARFPDGKTPERLVGWLAVNKFLEE